MTNIEKDLKEAVITGKCLHKIIAEYKQVSLCNEPTCEGYGVYLEGDEVVCCPKYKRVKNIEFGDEKG
jgi:hypothetical protein